MNEIDAIIEKGEKILWEGKPVFWPYYFPNVVLGLIALIFAPLIFPIIIALYLFIYPILYYNVVHYAITNRRVIFQTGVIGRDFKIVELSEINNSYVNVGIVDKIFNQNTGTISVFVPGDMMYLNTKRGTSAVPRPNMLAHIESPYEVFKYFKKVSFDVKTDIQYPNQYRPGVNPGYSTDYAAPPSPSKRTKSK
jgi:hypothetical protein